MEVEGTVICLIPDYQKGTVNPVVGGPCNGMPAHSHLLLGKDNKVYILQGLESSLMAIQKNPNHTDVKIMGQVEQTPGGWVLHVD